MTIDGLNALTALTAGDELPVWDVEASAEEPTKKITAQNMANSVKTLANLQRALTFDNTPTTGSINPVTSGGVADAITQSTATGQKSVVSLTNINTNITISDSYRVGAYGGTIAILFTIITVNTQVPAWTRLCTIADSNMMPAFNNQRWVLTNGTSSAVIYLNTNGSIETQTILPTGTYYAAIVYIRNNA